MREALKPNQRQSGFISSRLEALGAHLMREALKPNQRQSGFISSRLEALGAHLEDAPVRECEGLDDGRRLERQFLLEREVIPNVAHLWR